MGSPQRCILLLRNKELSSGQNVHLLHNEELTLRIMRRFAYKVSTYVEWSSHPASPSLSKWTLATTSTHYY